MALSTSTHWLWLFANPDRHFFSQHSSLRAARTKKKKGLWRVPCLGNLFPLCIWTKTFEQQYWTMWEGEKILFKTKVVFPSAIILSNAWMICFFFLYQGIIFYKLNWRAWEKGEHGLIVENCLHLICGFKSLNSKVNFQLTPKLQECVISLHSARETGSRFELWDLLNKLIPV